MGNINFCFIKKTKINTEAFWGNNIQNNSFGIKKKRLKLTSVNKICFFYLGMYWNSYGMNMPESYQTKSPQNNV